MGSHMGDEESTDKEAEGEWQHLPRFLSSTFSWVCEAARFQSDTESANSGINEFWKAFERKTKAENKYLPTNLSYISVSGSETPLFLNCIELHDA